MGSFWQTTCNALQVGVEPDWSEVYAYRQPVRLLLQARYPRLSPDDRDDLVEGILLELKDHLFERYLPERGPFRRFLCGVVRNRVLALLKRHRRQVALENAEDWLEQETAAPSVVEAECIDLAAELLDATRRWSTRHQALQPLQVKVLASYLFDDLAQKQVAEREGVPLIRVKRLLAEARLGIIAELLERTLPRPSRVSQGLDWKRLARQVRAVFAKPRAQHQILAEVADAGLRSALETWLDQYHNALAHMPGRTLPPGIDLLRGMRGILGAA